METESHTRRVPQDIKSKWSGCNVDDGSRTQATWSVCHVVLSDQSDALSDTHSVSLFFSFENERERKRENESHWWQQAVQCTPWQANYINWLVGSLGRSLVRSVADRKILGTRPRQEAREWVAERANENKKDVRLPRRRKLRIKLGSRLLASPEREKKTKIHPEEERDYLQTYALQFLSIGFKVVAWYTNCHKWCAILKKFNAQVSTFQYWGTSTADAFDFGLFQLRTVLTSVSFKCRCF